MADPKKDSKSGKPAGSKPFESLVTIMFVLAILGALFSRILEFVGDPEVAGAFSFPQLREYFNHELLPILYLVSYILSSFFIFGIAWSVTKLREINKELNATYGPPSISTVAGGNLDENRRWERVLGHLNSPNANDWKFAIIEADIMLGDLLDSLGYHGDTIAEKLKAIEPSDFTTIESAWEAHKVRNSIAHEGADFLLSEREAKRIIDLYRVVFDEFAVI